MVRLVVQLLVMVTRYGFSVFEFGGEVGRINALEFEYMCAIYIYIYIPSV